MLKYLDELSPTLNKGIALYIERLDLCRRDCDLLYDLIHFVHDEGKINGKEEYLEEHREFTNQIDKSENATETNSEI